MGPIMRASGWADEHGMLCVGRGKKIDEAVHVGCQGWRFFFIFTFFKKKFTEIYFGFQNLQFYTPTARQGAYRPPAGR